MTQNVVRKSEFVPPAVTHKHLLALPKLKGLSSSVHKAIEAHTDAVHPHLHAAAMLLEKEHQIVITPSHFSVAAVCPPDRILRLPMSPAIALSAVRVNGVAVAGTHLVRGHAILPPSTKPLSAVQIDYLAGFADGVPALVQYALALIAGHWVEDPEAAENLHIKHDAHVQQCLSMFLHPMAPKQVAMGGAK